MRVDVALGLGSNLGRSEEILASAVVRLGSTVRILAVAPLFRSRAQGPGRQPDYLNTAVVGNCRLTADELLAVTKELEQSAGRRRGRRNRPRPLDIDLLIFGSAVLTHPELTVPHPRLGERRFVLEPLARIASGLPVPPTGVTIGELLNRLGDRDPVTELAWTVDIRPRQTRHERRADDADLRRSDPHDP